MPCCIRYICTMCDFVRKVCAVLLLFLFLEKAALRLIIHTHLHNSKICKDLPSRKFPGYSNFSRLNCDCIDDFFIPLESIEPILLSFAILGLSINTFIVYHYTQTKVFALLLQLRGPPVNSFFTFRI